MPLEQGFKGDLGQAIFVVEDDVIDLVVSALPEDFSQVYRREGGFWS